MKRIKVLVAIVLVLVSLFPMMVVYAGNFAYKDFKRGDFIELTDGKFYWVQDKLDEQNIDVRQYQIFWKSFTWKELKKELKAIYKPGTNGWCEMSQEYLK